MLSLAFVPDVRLAGGLYIIRAALMNVSVPLQDSYLMGIMSQDERGLASAINTVIWRIPNSITTVIGGLILATGSFEIPFYLATVFYVISISLFYTQFKNIRPQSEELPQVAAQVIEMRKKYGRPYAFWAQLGLENEEAKRMLSENKIPYVMNACLRVVHKLL